MNLPGNGAILKLMGGKTPAFKVWTDYGEFDLPSEFETADKWEQFRMVTKAVITGMNEYWNGEMA
jgi:hypothetical protein